MTVRFVVALGCELGLLRHPHGLALRLALQFPLPFSLPFPLLHLQLLPFHHRFLTG